MYPQEEIAEILLKIEKTLIDIALAKNENVTVCDLLSSLSLDIQKVSTLFQHAERLRRMKDIRLEKKKFLTFVSTLEHWSKYKNWGEICGSIDDIGDELLQQVYELRDVLEKKIITKKTKSKEGNLIDKRDEREYLEKVSNNVSKKVVEKNMKHDNSAELASLRDRAAKSKARIEALSLDSHESHYRLPPIFASIFR